MIRPLGWRTRVYECEIVSALADTPLQRQILVAVGDDNQAYLFTFEGPATQVAALERAFTTLVISFEAAPR